MASELSRFSNLDCHVMDLTKGKHTKTVLMPCKMQMSIFDSI